MYDCCVLHSMYSRWPWRGVAGGIRNLHELVRRTPVEGGNVAGMAIEMIGLLLEEVTKSSHDSLDIFS